MLTRQHALFRPAELMVTSVTGSCTGLFSQEREVFLTHDKRSEVLNIFLKIFEIFKINGN